MASRRLTRSERAGRSEYARGRRHRPLALLAAVLALPGAAFAPAVSGRDGLSAQARPLPNPDVFLAETRENLARSMRLQSQYAYKERRTELHMNPFGRLGTGDVVLYEMTPSGDGSAVWRRLLERNGEPVRAITLEKLERRGRRRQERSPVDDAVATLRFTIDRRERLNGREAIVVRFEPRPDADPSTREGRIARVMAGSIWIDEAAREIARVEATAIDDISFGLGILARLDEGTRVTLTRESVDGDLWLPTALHFTGRGRAILFRRLEVDHEIEWFDYRRIPPAPPNPGAAPDAANAGDRDR